MSDEADIANQYADEERERILNARKNATREQPDVDDDGNRVCLDCGDIIPLQRVIAVDAVTCIGCQQLRDDEDRRYR